MKQLSPFPKVAELFRWGPIPGRYFYVSEFEDGMFKEFSRIYEGVRCPSGFFLFNNKRMVWINDFEELRQAGKEIFLKYMLKQNIREKIKKQWDIKVKILSDFEKKIDDLYLNDLGDQELYELWKKFYDLVIVFWSDALPAELGNYGSDKLLEEKLKKYIKDENELSSVMEILTALESPSFYQEEEIDLVKSKDLEKHTKKYFWLRNSYSGVEKLSVDFFEKRKKELPLNIKKLIDDRTVGLKKKKRKIIQKYKLSKEIKDITNALCAVIEWQDERKKHIFIYLHYKELFLKEVARRFNYNIDSLRNCSSLENMQILEKRGVHSLIERRANVFGFFMGPITEEIIGGDAVFFWEKYSSEKADEPIVPIEYAGDL